MQIYPIDGSNTTATGNQAAATTTSGVKTLGQSDFLKLISVQMQTQDPLNPMKDTDFIAQMANFTSLEQMKNLTGSFDSFSTEQRSVSAQNYIGKNVTVQDSDAGLVTGTVSAVTFQDGNPLLLVNGKTYDPKFVTAIRPSSTTTPASS